MDIKGRALVQQTENYQLNLTYIVSRRQRGSSRIDFFHHLYPVLSRFDDTFIDLNINTRQINNTQTILSQNRRAVTPVIT